VPWSEITPMSQRLSFIRLYCQRRRTMAELCAEFHISEKTGYKWVRRFSTEGEAGLADRSHAPHAVPHRMPAEVASELLALRRAHPTWGPRKLRAASMARDPATRWPAPSSIGALLKSAGLVRPRRHRTATGASGESTHWGRTPAYEPNVATRPPPVLRADQPVPTPAAAVVDVFINALNLSPHQAFTSAAYSSAASSHPKWSQLTK
jgi:transposase-like protein